MHAKRPDLDVAIVSTNPETLDGLQAYLRGAGVTARCTRDLAACTKLARPSTLAFVFFPDDYEEDRVLATLAELAEERPGSFPVLVTAHPKRFEKLTAEGELLVVPRPVWGWTILDAIREQVDRRQGRKEEDT